MFRVKILLCILLFFPAFTHAQEMGQVYGNISDKQGKALEFANVSLKSDPSVGAVSNFDGNYSLSLPAGENFTLLVSYAGYQNTEITLKLFPGEKRKLNFQLKPSDIVLGDVDIKSERERSANMVRLNPKIASSVLSATGGVEQIIRSLPGVVGNNELSSQYSVRGGNFDENLVYVNDIEIYRPFLIRSGQQEGLSFVNPDMVSSLLFSAGGFEARYGDKMSSVLDIKYKRPTSFKASASGSLLGGSAHVEGAAQNQLLSYIAGIRYSTNQYLLGSLDEKGSYTPEFLDFQTFVTYEIGTNFELNFLGHLSQNSYYFIPETRETSFGTIHEALKLKIYFDGQELNRFTTFTGALAGHYEPGPASRLSLFVSSFNTRESETFDILGQYFLNELDNQLGSDNLGDSLANIGVGSFLNHARNYLDAQVYSIYHKGLHRADKHFFQWGAKAQWEFFSDQMNEWNLIDSAGYSLPYSDSEVLLYRYLQNDTSLQSQRYTSYFQDTYTHTGDAGELSITAGFRTNYWTISREFLFSPRANVAFKPKWKNSKRDILFRLAAGMYHQPPFFREMKDWNGRINTDIKAQRSTHFVVGADYNFVSWNRPFKFVAEAYYKELSNLIPYDVDNVRLRYYGTNNSEGYAGGLDLKVNGEFVPGVDSWISLSLMQTREHIDGQFSYEIEGADTLSISPVYIPRPTDQFFTFSMFFQDYFPNDSTIKMQLNMMYGSGLPFGPPNAMKTQADLRMPSYRRVDIGFSKLIIGENALLKRKGFRHLESLWLGLEVFNLLNIRNTVSYTWINDIRNQQYAVPNYLTSRRINVRVVARF